MATIHIFGRLTGDPETRLMPNNGGTVTSFSLADNHGKDANNQDKVDFFRCSAFGKQADLIFNSCKKGHRLNVSGRFESRQYQAKDGTTATSLEVSVNAFDFVEPRDQSAAPQQQPAPAQAARGPAAQPPAGQPQFQYDSAGNGWSLVNNQWVMTHPARPAAPVAPAAPQQFTPTQQPAPAFPPNTCPPGERPF